MSGKFLRWYFMTICNGFAAIDQFIDFRCAISDDQCVSVLEKVMRSADCVADHFFDFDFAGSGEGGVELIVKPQFAGLHIFIDLREFIVHRVLKYFMYVKR